MAKKKAVRKKKPTGPVPKTKEQVDAEIAALTEIKPRVRRYTMFGDDHHAAIDAQLDVLERRLSEDDIYRDFGVEEDEERSESIFGAALDARSWMNGEDVETPSVNWKELAK